MRKIKGNRTLLKNYWKNLRERRKSSDYKANVKTRRTQMEYRYPRK